MESKTPLFTRIVICLVVGQIIGVFCALVLGWSGWALFVIVMSTTAGTTFVIDAVEYWYDK